MLDFPKRAVREPIPDEKFRYGFEIAPELVRTVLRDDEPDWVNTIFLSTRFKAWRVGGYNEYLYTFFKCLTDERIAYADGWFAETHDDSASIHLDGWEIQRRCPHLKADLSKFGVVEGSTLTCNLHGWQWNLRERQVPDVQGPRAAECEARERPRPQFYDDGLVQLDRQALTLRRYHFPSGTSKIIPLQAHPRLQGRVTGPVHAIGSGSGARSDLRRWLPMDVWRPIKSTLVTLDVPGSRTESGVHAVAGRGVPRRPRRPAGPFTVGRVTSPRRTVASSSR